MEKLGWEEDAFTLPPASPSCIPPLILHMTVQRAASPHTHLTPLISHAFQFLLVSPIKQKRELQPQSSESACC